MPRTLKIGTVVSGIPKGRGARFRRLREERGLSIKDVSRATSLTMEKIGAIESDQEFILTDEARILHSYYHKVPRCKEKCDMCKNKATCFLDWGGKYCNNHSPLPM